MFICFLSHHCDSLWFMENRYSSKNVSHLFPKTMICLHETPVLRLKLVPVVFRLLSFLIASLQVVRNVCLVSA